MSKIFKEVESCEGEIFIKEYECTTFKSRLLGINTKGTLGVTNKRVIFNANGSSITGTSTIQNEVPIKDISGLGFYKGTYVSLRRLILTFILLGAMSPIIIKTISYLSIKLATEEYSVTRNMAVYWIFAIGFGIVGFLVDKQKVSRTIMYSIATLSFSNIYILESFSRSIFRSHGNSSDGSVKALAMLATILFAGFTFYSLVLYSRRETITMSIKSTGGGSTPIHISGIKGLGFSNQSAPRALEAEPAVGANTMIEELGALIADVQQMGDLAIELWNR